MARGSGSFDIFGVSRTRAKRLDLRLVKRKKRHRKHHKKKHGK